MKTQFLINSLIIFLLSFNFTLTQSSSFWIELNSFQEKCLSDYYKAQTVIVFQLDSNFQETQLEVRSPDGRILFHDTSLFSLTAPNSGFYSVCAKNLGKFIGEIKLTIKSGVSANDFSSVPKSKDLEPIDYEIEKLLQKRSTLNHYHKVSQEKQNQFTFIYKTISNKIIFYSLLMIAGMILIGVIETLYLKRFMEKRKII